MVDRLRVLLDHPLEPSVARAIVILSGAILLGLATLFALAAGERGASPQIKVARTAPSVVGSTSANLESAPAGEAALPRYGQDPQDRKGSHAARRAARALASHRALQHVPYRRGELRIELVGARGHRAVLHIIAGTARAAQRGWRSFLRRYRDSGHAYITIFRSRQGERDG